MDTLLQDAERHAALFATAGILFQWKDEPPQKPIEFTKEILKPYSSMLFDALHFQQADCQRRATWDRLRLASLPSSALWRQRQSDNTCRRHAFRMGIWGLRVAPASPASCILKK
jgi:hypothetical protein